MSILGQKYELPANGAERVTNSCIVAALNTIGIGGGRQITEHRRKGSSDYKYFAFHLETDGPDFPGFKTASIVGRFQRGEIPRDGPWDEPTKLFMAAWIALENRRVLLEAEHSGGVSSLRMRKIGENLCQLEHPGGRSLNDLRTFARDANEPTARVVSKVLLRALITVGFAPVQFLEDGGALVTVKSLTFPDLTLGLCLNAQGQILDFNRRTFDAVSRGDIIMPSPPVCELPGAGPHGHPFENALQGGLNLSQIFQYVLPKAGKTYAFQSPHHSTRSAIIDASAAANDIHQALEFANKR